MTHSCLTLTKFLLARIAEDEKRYEFDPSEYGYGHNFRMAECKAKRRIVEELSRPSVTLSGAAARRVAEIARDVVLGNLALPYADHEDYREEWKP